MLVSAMFVARRMRGLSPSSNARAGVHQSAVSAHPRDPSWPSVHLFVRLLMRAVRDNSVRWRHCHWCHLSLSVAHSVSVCAAHALAVPQQWCNGCFTTKLASDFERDAAAASGLQTLCKACMEAGVLDPEVPPEPSLQEAQRAQQAEEDSARHELQASPPEEEERPLS
jgi:hypothetical protein